MIRHKYVCEMENQQVKSLSLEKCQVALQYSLIEEIDLIDVESILVSLISQVNQIFFIMIIFFTIIIIIILKRLKYN